MAGQSWAHISAAFLAASALVIASTALGQSNSPQELEAARPPGEPNNIDTINQVTGSYGPQLLAVPMVNTTPGAVKTPRAMENPMAHDGQSASRGMKYFISFNCVGCHAANGGGGMGPQLSDAALFKYGTDPDVLFLVISHGRAARHAGVGDGSAAERYLGPRELYRKHQQNTAAGVGRYGIGCGEFTGHRADSRGIQTNSHPLGFHRAFQQGRKPTGANPTAAQSEPNISPR